MEKVRAIANKLGVSVAQVAIAWLKGRAASERAAIVPLIGARRRDQLTESLGALQVSLNAEQMAEIERAAPPEAVAGARYPEIHLQHMDSERETDSGS